MDSILFSSSTDEWATPQPLFDQISEVFGPFDLDPCADKFTAKAPVYFTRATHGGDGGLVMAWGDAHRPTNVFVNPPFNRKKGLHIEPWIRKAWEEVELGRARQVVMLIPARPDLRVWHDTIFPHASLVAWIKGRIQFVGPSEGGQSATFPSALVVFCRVAGAGKFRQGPQYVTWEQRR